MATQPKTRIEHDSMGELQVPADASWGAQTQRALENFPVSGIPMHPRLIHALGAIKAAAAEVNGGLGLLDARRASAIAEVGRLVAEGEYDDEFPLDRFQTLSLIHISEPTRRS